VGHASACMHLVMLTTVVGMHSLLCRRLLGGGWWGWVEGCIASACMHLVVLSLRSALLWVSIRCCVSVCWGGGGGGGHHHAWGWEASACMHLVVSPLGAALLWGHAWYCNSIWVRLWVGSSGLAPVVGGVP
jgi:hypothetical protein